MCDIWSYFTTVTLQYLNGQWIGHLFTNLYGMTTVLLHSTVLALWMQQKTKQMKILIQPQHTNTDYVRGKADTEIKNMGRALITGGMVCPVGWAVDESLETPARVSVLPGQESTSHSRFQERNKLYQWSVSIVPTFVPEERDYWFVVLETLCTNTFLNIFFTL